MLYLVTYSDGSQGVLTAEQLSYMLEFMPGVIVSWEPYVEPVPEPEPEPPPPPRPPPCSIFIDAPASAPEGGTVVVLTTITNNSPYAEVYKYEIFAGAEPIGSVEDTIPAGGTKSYYAAFIMPGADVTILVRIEVWYPDTLEWNYNNSASKAVSLEPQEPVGALTRLTVLYDGQEAAFGSTLTTGRLIRGSFYGHNQMAIPQLMGFGWEIRDPNGEVLEGALTDPERYAEVPPDQYAHQITAQDLSLDIPGAYTIKVWLLTNPSAPITLDYFEGVMVTAVGVAEPTGEIVRIWIDHAADTNIDVPAQRPADNRTFEIHVRGRNTSPINIAGGVDMTVFDPDGALRFRTPEVTWKGVADSGGENEWEENITELDKPGVWTATIIFLSRDYGELARYEGVIIEAVEVEAEYDEVQHTIYPYSYVYDGDVEVTIATFKTDPFTPSDWMADTFARKLEEEVRANGGRPLEVKVDVDTSPLLWTNFRIEVISTPLEGAIEAGPGIAVGIPIWAAILIIALAIIAVIVVLTLAFQTVMDSFKRKPGLEDMKPAWGKETLILAICDSEEFWERTPTPSGELEGMSEAELRVLLDEIAEEEVAPALGWGTLAIVGVGGIAVVGVGAAVALAARPKE